MNIWNLGYEVRPQTIQIEITNIVQPHFPILSEGRTISSFGSKLYPESTVRFLVYLDQDFLKQLENEGNLSNSLNALVIQLMYRLDSIKIDGNQEYYAEIQNKLPHETKTILDNSSPIFTTSPSLSQNLDFQFKRFVELFDISVAAQGACSLDIISCQQETSSCTCNLGGLACAPGVGCGPRGLGTCECTPGCYTLPGYDCGMYLSSGSCNSAGCTGNACAAGGWCSWSTPDTPTPRPPTPTPRPGTPTVAPPTPTTVTCGGSPACGAGSHCCGSTCVDNSISGCPQPGSCSNVTCTRDQPGVPGANTLPCPAGSNHGFDPVKTIDPTTGRISFDFLCGYNWGNDNFGDGGLSVYKNRDFIGKIDNFSGYFSYTDPVAIQQGAAYLFIPSCLDGNVWDDDPNSQFQKAITYCSRYSSIPANPIATLCDAKPDMTMSRNVVAGNPEATFTVSSSGGIGSTWVDDSWSGNVGPPCNSGFWGSKTCPITSAGTISWTHYWRICNGSTNPIDCFPLDDGNPATKTDYCSKTITDGPTSTPTPIATPTPIPVSTIKGYKVKMPGNKHTPPNSVSNETITLDPLLASTQTTANPFTFANIIPGLHTITATLPAVNYSVGYTLCYNDDPNCDRGNFTMGNSADVTSPSGGNSDIWFHYWEYISWVRLKRTSFHSQKTGTWYNFIPPTILKYDGADTTQLMLNVDELDFGTAKGAGLITGEGVMDLGPNSPTFSNNDFSKQNYAVGARGYLDDLPAFIEYAKARKDVKIVANMSEVEASRINIIQSNLGVIDDNIPGGTEPIIVIVQGNVMINPSATAIFNSTRQPLVLISTGKITVEPTVKEIAAILIAKEFDLGSSATPLKIVGNLISQTPVVTTVRQRPIAEYQQASVYVVFQPRFYEAALPYLSTIIQEGRQLK
ncbi:hypothetical protein KBD81_00360 [Candidatus Woesebacteria bacterium]|nr:hypothetical protein [Candidatus Woesebacteria bacterium]